MSNHELLAPVAGFPDDTDDGEPESGLALCLSGGGYRAMLFHVGALWRLNNAGYLPQLKRISSVSGGSITAGVLGLAWPKLAFGPDGVGQRFAQEVVAPVQRLASRTIDIPSVLLGVFGPRRVSEHVIRAYQTYLFGKATLQDLPDTSGPRFVINATNLQSGALWRFSRSYARDYLVGNIPAPKILLAEAVAASSAFPPFLSPVVLRRDETEYDRLSGKALQRPPYTTRVFLTDGGVYDNLGLETAWKRYTTILVSDGGAHLGPEPHPYSNWVLQSYRMLNVIDNQVRSLRKRQVIGSYQSDTDSENHRDGAYWGIRTDIAKYRLPNALNCPFVQTTKLANVSTRLGRLSETLQKQLVNWGFAVCDAAMRRHVDPALPAPGGFPYPDAGVG
jgi:NTE family protein